jgi:hypothetical protein
VEVTLACNLVAASNDFRNDIRAPVSSPAEGEKSRFRSGGIEEIERGLGVSLDIALEARPMAARDDPAEGGHLEIVF